MNFKKIKNVFFLCANEGCHNLISTYFVIQNEDSKPRKVGLCEDCSFELYQHVKFNNVKGGN